MKGTGPGHYERPRGRKAPQLSPTRADRISGYVMVTAEELSAAVGSTRVEIRGHVGMPQSQAGDVAKSLLGTRFLR